MFSDLRKISTGYLAMSLFYLVFGILICIDPESVQKITCYVIGSVFVIYGIVRMINYFIHPGLKPSMAIGIVCVVLGILVFAFSSTLIKAIPFLFGLLLVVDNASNIQTAVLMKKSGASQWWIGFVMAIVMLGAGVFLMCRPGFAAKIIMYLIGAGLIVNAIFNLWNFYAVSREVKRVKKASQIPAVIVEDSKQ